MSVTGAEVSGNGQVLPSRFTRRFEQVLGSEALKDEIIGFIEPSDVLNLELACTRTKISNAYWSRQIRMILGSVLGGIRLLRKVKENSGAVSDDKRLYWALRALRDSSIMHRGDAPRLVPDFFAANACSSVDRDTEGPLNVNRQSYCFLRLRDRHMLGKEVPDEVIVENLTPMANHQIECGCALSDACYWCTKASPTNDAEEWIDFGVHRESKIRRKLRSYIRERKESDFDIVCIHSFAVTVYRSYVQPRGPIFAPRRIKMELWKEAFKDEDDIEEGEDDGLLTSAYKRPDELCWESDEYDVILTEAEQHFKLPSPLFIPMTTREIDRYKIRFKIFGAAQRQTIDPSTGVEHADWFYVCLSNVQMRGWSLQNIAKHLEALQTSEGESSVPHLYSLPKNVTRDSKLRELALSECHSEEEEGRGSGEVLLTLTL